MYYPAGVTDPDYCVLKFVAVSGRYYANFNSESFDIERGDKKQKGGGSHQPESGNYNGGDHYVRYAGRKV